MWKINRPNSNEFLKNEKIRSLLKDYFGIMPNKKLFLSKDASMIEADGSGDIDTLWDEHESTKSSYN